MNNTYTSLVKQTFHFPQEGFDIGDNNYLEFNVLDMMYLIDNYGMLMKFNYLLKIGIQIKKTNKMF